MDIKTYIESGILESYLLGDVTEQERQEVSCLSHIYPEIQEELDLLSETMLLIGEANAVNPPQKLRANILDAIKNVEQEPKESKLKVVHSSDEKKEKTPTITPKESSNDNNGGMYKWIAAASILLLLGVGVWSMSNKNTLESSIADIKEENDVIKAQSENLNLTVSAQNETLAILQNTSTESFVMNGIEANAPDAIAKIYYNTDSKDVYLLSGSLPSTTDDKQYQLWAIVDGAPVDLGVFDNSTAMLKMKNIENPQAFAVTLEPIGGSVNPTMEQMFVLGYTAKS